MSDALLVKILLVGDGTVGKSQLLIRYVESRFNPNFIVTIGVDTRQKIVVHRGHKFKIQVWDAAGNEQFRTISPAYYKNAHAIVIAYDITNYASFEHVEYWKQQAVEHGLPDVPVVVVGNKIDLVDANTVSLRIPAEDEQQLSSKLGTPFLSASAKTGLGVEELFAAILDLVVHQRFVPDGLVLAQSHSPPPTRWPCACSWRQLFGKPPAPPFVPITVPISGQGALQDAPPAPSSASVGTARDADHRDTGSLESLVDAAQTAVDEAPNDNENATSSALEPSSSEKRAPCGLVASQHLAHDDPAASNSAPTERLEFHDEALEDRPGTSGIAADQIEFSDVQNSTLATRTEGEGGAVSVPCQVFMSLMAPCCKVDAR